MDYGSLYSINYINMPITTYICLIVMVIIIVLLITKRKSLNKKVGRWIIFALICSAPFSLGGAYNHLSHASSLKSGDYILVEGKVEDFSPASSRPTKRIESFQVNGKKFEYSIFMDNGGLRHSLSDCVKNGSDVKVYYKYNAILRIEVKK